jgi:DNA-directed RNA polymerase subunit RPC12/RpoP
MKFSLKDTRIRRASLIALLVLGVLLLVWGGLMLAGVFDSPKKLGETKVDANRCPHCNLPLSKVAKEKGECLFCHGDLPTKQRGVGEHPASKAVIGGLIGAFAILATINLVFFVRSWKGKDPEEAFYHLNCKKCTRKVRYRQRQIGQFARCPICRQLIRFPEPPEQPKGTWGKLKDWLKRPKKKKAAVEDSA